MVGFLSPNTLCKKGVGANLVLHERGILSERHKGWPLFTPLHGINLFHEIEVVQSHVVLRHLVVHLR